MKSRGLLSLHQPIKIKIVIVTINIISGSSKNGGSYSACSMLWMSLAESV